MPHGLENVVGRLCCINRGNANKINMLRFSVKIDNRNKCNKLSYLCTKAPLRRNVQRALNRGESYHQLRRAVSYANYGKLRFKTEYEQQLWGECSRLVTNCIIYYNAIILSDLLAHKERTDDRRGAALLTQVSPVAWQHVNLHGRYEFRKSPETINIHAIVQELSQLSITQAAAV